MASQVPFTFSGVLSFPPDDGEAVADRPYSVADFFESKAEYKYELSGSGNIDVNFGTIQTAGAKGILIEVAPDSSPSAAPILVTVNAGSEPIEISPGGFMAVASPVPTAAGVTSINIAHTTSNTVRVRLLG